MKIAFVILVALHGAIHAMGFAKAFGLASLEQLHVPISKPIGVLWLIAALAFVATAAALSLGARMWWAPALVAIVVSQTVIVLSWSDAKLGTIANAIVLVPLSLALLDLRSSSFRSTYEREVEAGHANRARRPPILDRDLDTLPPLIAGYLRRVGVVGKPRILGFHARFSGWMKNGASASPMSISVDQTSFVSPPTRLFLMSASKMGMPFEALHMYRGPSATMQVRIASLFEVVDAHGPKMDRSETVTLFNDWCLLAPMALLDANVVWETVDARRVAGTFTNASQTIRAELTFDDAGDLVSFVSNDRFASADGRTYESFPWSTPISEYRVVRGFRLPYRADAIWLRPEGPYTYAHFVVDDVEFDFGN
jgi:hypothetical protein